MNILLVDDDERSSRLVKRFLQSPENTIAVASSVATALSLFDIGHFDLVITDQCMPDGTGQALAMALRKRGVVIPIILLTGSEDSMQSEKPTGFDLLLCKPISREDLLEGIQRVMKRV